MDMSRTGGLPVMTDATTDYISSNREVVAAWISIFTASQRDAVESRPLVAISDSYQQAQGSTSAAVGAPTVESGHLEP